MKKIIVDESGLCWNCLNLIRIWKVDPTECSNCKESNANQLAVLRLKHLNKKIVQRHHMTYGGDEATVLLFKGEHYPLTLLQRLEKSVYTSDGFIEALEYIINNLKKKTKVDLEKIKNENL